MKEVPPPENLPGANPIDDIDAEVRRIQALTGGDDKPTPEKPKEIVTATDPFKADYARRVSLNTAPPPTVPKEVAPTHTTVLKPEVAPAPIPTPPLKQNVIPFPTRPKAPELIVPPAPSLEGRAVPFVHEEKKDTRLEKESEYKRLQKEADIAQKRALIAKKRADLAAEELELDKLEAA
jgi:hypothetical protein